MLRDFRGYLIQERLDRINTVATKKQKSQKLRIATDKADIICWIERLLQTPIADHRKYCIWRALTPYLINIRGLSDEQALSVIMTWLDKCKTVRRLSFYPKPRAREQIRRVRNIGYYPISLNNLKIENPDLYDLVMEEQEK
jgi:hypothetical protein